ncbi:hypothetical protein SAMN05518672_1022 [Chitinophaga sp. CF118]|uniref:fibronectin type III domain-containing protein n=1 Tax=Chitinophaga sp. CF118 TaxID=1884367 RepID=UPI0008E8C006|nr:hypothetical protein [Chitinophaga sp. CF118]SFD45091.1 hypothetical protein SAMN05518672_1022 [Chitinophaga sp. CF118]
MRDLKGFRASVRIMAFVCLVALVPKVKAQQKSSSAPPPTPAVMVLAKPQKDAIWLRWAINSPLAWKYANNYGYTIERYTITRGGHALTIPERKLLTPVPVKPHPQPDWKPLTDSSDGAAIIAMALYGESFKSTIEQGKGGMMEIASKATELEERFGYALFACDGNFGLAKFAGLGWVDSTAKQDEKYLYRVFTNIPAAKMKTDTGAAYVGLKDYQVLPPPLDLSAVFNDRKAMLSWNFTLLKQIYNSYIIERSEGAGKPFVRINAQPLVNANERDSSGPTRIYYVDSLPQNFATYMYRVKGMDAFGEYGAPSDTVTGQGLPSLPYNPRITASDITGSNQVSFGWEFPKEGNALIKSFSIVSAPNVGGPYDTLQANIPASERKWILKKPLQASNYMAVVANGLDGTHAPSFPVLVQPIDSIPPAVPSLLKGKVDTTGRVTIHWPANMEKDLMGYRIFRGTRADAEFIQLTVSPQADTVFYDTVQVNTLHTKIYYKIQAVDQRYNTSKFSDILELTKPDLQAPSAPAFKHYSIEGGKVKLYWINSYEKTVASYQVLRKRKDSVFAVWQVLKDIPNAGAEEDSLTDPIPLRDVEYQYTVQSIGANGKISPQATPLTIYIAKDITSISRPKISCKADREEKAIIISWRMEQGDVAQYWLYRAEGDQPPALLQTFTGAKQDYTDSQLRINTIYQYTIKAILKSGQQSQFSVIEKVTY